MNDSLADRLAETTLALCAIPSVTGDERAIADHLEARVRTIPGARVRRLGESVVAEHGQGPVVALFGHSDTVRPANDQPLVIEHGRVFGCGASDMKGGLAVMLALLDEAGAGAFPGVTLRCVFYDREEGPAAESGMVSLLADADPVDRAVTLALCLEPTDNRVEAGCVGSLHARLSFLGKRAHSARPWQGENAIYRAAPFLAAMRERPRRPAVVGGLTYYEVLTVTTATTDNSRNVVPDRFALNLNFRFAPGRSEAAAIEELRALVPEGAELEIIDSAPAGGVRLDEPRLAAWIVRAQIQVEAKQAWTDVARLAARGVAAVNFGPGATAEAHQARESVAIHALVAHHAALGDLLK